MRIKTSSIVIGTVAALIFGFSLYRLVTTFDWTEVVHGLRRIKWWLFLIFLVSTTFVYNMLRTWRWLVLVRRVNNRVRFKDLIVINIISINLAIFTPASIGEGLKIELLKRKGFQERIEGVGTFFLEKIADFIVVAVLAFVGTIVVVSDAGEFSWIIPTAVTVVGILFAALFVWSRIRLPGRIGRFQKRLQDGGLKLRGLLPILGISCLSWSIVAFQWYGCFRMAGVSLPLVHVIWVLGTVTMGILVSMVPGGLGITELLIFELFLFVGVPAGGAQLSALLLRVFFLGCLAIGALSFLSYAAAENFASTRKRFPNDELPDNTE